MLYVSMLSVALVFAGLNGAEGAETASNRFFQNLSKLCGQTYVGQAIETEESANPFGDERLVMHVRKCADTEIHIGFHVGENRSRTWVVSQTDGGLQLKHIHLGEDGEPDLLSFYGGMATSPGTEGHQEFPADPYSKELFASAGVPQSQQNTWTLEIGDQEYFVYDLTRPEYNVRVEFDLKTPVSAPPPIQK